MHVGHPEASGSAVLKTYICGAPVPGAVGVRPASKGVGITPGDKFVPAPTTGQTGRESLFRTRDDLDAASSCALQHMLSVATGGLWGGLSGDGVSHNPLQATQSIILTQSSSQSA